MVAIKSIEMPKECYMCPLLDGEYGACNIIGATKIDMTEERAKNCPLVEVITCKDCVHRIGCKCESLNLIVADDGYCSNAERKE